ncbi:feruloyl esterase B [Pestalotiopsis sp. NC0098]|nr:feruloyl esterase B [Pestalotiopsis sp. NC0098]
MKSALSLVLSTAAIATGVRGTYTTPAVACESLTAPVVEGAVTTSINATSVNATDAGGYCAVSVYLTHGNASDNVLILTWLPVSWNGRYQGTGGGGAVAGGSSSALVAPVASGYAAGTTNAGLPNSADGSAWANNTQLVTNFAYLSVHEMTVVGKALAEQFYGRAPDYSYWNGCSTGGRQGHMEVQRYPSDYQGVYAASPAINYDTFQPAELWPFVVQTNEGEFVPQCVFTALTDAAIALCDADDGAEDGLIVNPNTCGFDAYSQVGQAVNCSGNATTVTERQAKIFNSIAHGPVDTEGNKLFSGLPLGSSLATIAGTTPVNLISAWIKDFVLHEPDFNLSSITYETYPQIFNLSVAEYKDLIGTRNPDLAPFHAAGGKLLSWHGFADSLIGGNGTVQYRVSVQDVLGGPDAVDEFYRLYMAPGVEHCGGGYGATPTDPFDVLVAWVENGTAPDTLPASGNGITRNLCRFPLQLQYSGDGDVDLAESWTCV